LKRSGESDTGSGKMKKNKKIIWQIFPSFLLITLLCLCAVTAYSTSYFKKFFIKNSEKELTIRAKLLRDRFIDELEKDPVTRQDRIDAICKEIGKTTGTRVTIILPSGVVVGDSFGNVNIMENHMKRPEIASALKRKKAVAVRRSPTLGKKMMYVAMPVMVEDRVMAVIRTSISLSAIDSRIRSARNNMFVAMLFTVFAAAAASLYVARHITMPIEQMRKGAAEFAAGNLDARLAVPASEELSELAVTMNRMAENLDRKIRQARERSMELEAVHSSMQEGVIAIDRNEKIITANAAAAAIFDFAPSYLRSRNILEVTRNVEFQNFIKKALATHEPVSENIVLSRNDDIMLNIHSSALYDAGRTRIGTLVIFHDITRIKRLERLHKDFAANVSHELKTPLTSVKGFIETLQEMLSEDRDYDLCECRRFLTIIEKNINRMIDLINDLLSLSKLERLQGTDIELEAQPVASLIAGAVHVCHSAAEARDCLINVDCPEDLEARVDPVLMEQAIVNLVDNAVKYGPHRGRVEIKARACAEGIEIVVRDNGCGMDQSHLSKIFNRFYRVDKARSRYEGGTGLGLAIVKHIVQYHNGRVDVSSVRNMGSVFTITLPA